MVTWLGQLYPKPLNTAVEKLSSPNEMNGVLGHFCAHIGYFHIPLVTMVG